MNYHRVPSLLAPVTDDPRRMPGVVGWWSADQVAPVADGATVPLWQDRSGYGGDAEHPTDGNRPTYWGTIFGGRPALLFDGVDDNLYTTVAGSVATRFSGTDLPLSIIAAVAKLSNNTIDTIVSLVNVADTGVVARHIFGQTATGVMNTTRRDDAALEALVSAGSGIANTSRRIVTFTFPGTSATIYLDGGGLAGNAQNVGAATFGLFRIGGGIAGADPFHGYIAEIIVFNRGLALGRDHQRPERYLHRKYSSSAFSTAA